jgi:hypothetical protein
VADQDGGAFTVVLQVEEEASMAGNARDEVVKPKWVSWGEAQIPLFEEQGCAGDAPFVASLEAAFVNPKVDFDQVR